MRHPASPVRLLTGLLALSILGCRKTPDAAIATTSPTTTTVASIDSVRCAITQSNPPHLVVTAFGMVPTGGWSGERLAPRVYVAAPADGIWDYDFTATPPSGMSTQVITPISAGHRWPDFPAATLRGVRVHGVGSGVKESALQACHR